jgi:hypothetical protein
MTDSGQSVAKVTWSVWCRECPWEGYRKQRRREDAEADSCPQCGGKVETRWIKGDRRRLLA